jgi:hypothetical protein
MTLMPAFYYPEFSTMAVVVARKINNHDEYAPRPDPQISTNLYEILRCCWSEDPARRPTAEHFRSLYMNLPEPDRVVQAVSPQIPREKP